MLNIKNFEIKEKKSHQSNKNKKFKSRNPNKQDSNANSINFSSPNINIHIHVPSYNSNNSKIYLPRIQPVIHLHFDEIVRRLEKNKQSERNLYCAFKNLLSNISPKFGDVRFHFNDESSEENNTDKVDENSETPRSSRSCCNDSCQSTEKKKRKIESDTSENIEMGSNQSNNTNSLENNSNDNEENVVLSKYKNLKLKKATVLLTDVCKSGAWKNVETTTVEKFQDDSLQEDKNNHEEDIEECLIKQENDSLNYCSPSFSGSCNQNQMFNNCFENNFDNFNSEELVVNKSSVEDTVADVKSLTALAEGCSFSEILSRFKVKCKQYVVDNANQPVNGHKETDVRCNSERDSNCFNDAINENNETDYKSDLIKAKLDLVDKNVINKNTLDKTNPFLLQMTEDNFNVKIENSDSLSESNKDDNGFESSADAKSDESYTTLANGSSPELIMDSETLKCYSSFKITSSAHEGNFNGSETKQRSLIDVAKLDLHLKLIKKEMRRRNRTSFTSRKRNKNKNKNIKKKSDNVAVKSDSSPSPKRSDIRSEKKELNVSPTKDYIPLNTCGPTKFAVAPLDVINPYKTHSARTFKQEMLFGNRITRFSNSEKLRIYQLKQAARSSNK